jgi:hypothetical protein
LLDPDAKRQVIDTPSDTPCTLVIEWHAQPNASLFEALPTKRERLSKLIGFFEETKAPMKKKLSDAGIEIRDLPTSAQVVATAPAKKWRQILSDLEADPEVAVLPNKLYKAI